MLGDKPVATYTLPDLPYDYAALEKAISGQILELHHDKHHAAYVKGANDTLEKIAAARDSGDFGSIVGLEKTLAFNLSGHILHSIYWENLSPDGGDRPDGTLGAAIDESFGGFEKFSKQLTAVTRARAGACSRTTSSATGCSSSRSMTTRTGSALATPRSSCSTPGSTRSTCSTRT
jgi:Fe-Mn family superoxide dismutase